MSPVDVGLFAVGWMLGWLLLWRGRPLPSAARDQTPRAPIAVVIPARDEGTALAELVPALRRQLRDGDELVVVDDHSTDDTAPVARQLGATVITPPDLAPGWLGKPNACWAGAAMTTASTLLFVDADVAPPPDLLDRVASALERHAGSVVSVQPWHRTVALAEQASMLCNVAALMGSGAFTVAGDRLAPRVAFGPVLAVRRDVYEQVGGHALVRSMHTEDIGLARAVGSTALFSGRPDISFRMYPRGFRQLFDGWTRSIATGAHAAPWWLTVATAAWVTAIAGGWLSGGWPTSHPIETVAIYALCAVQLWILGRRAGSIHPVTALLYPVATAVFLVIVVRSAIFFVLRRDVTWKDRRVAARSS